MCAMWCFYVVLIAAFDLVVIASLPQTAFVEIAICENTKQCSSVYPAYKLKGSFTNIGSKDKAEGDVLQIHPFGLCNISNGDALYEAEWVGVVKLTIPSRESRECNGTVQKALGAIQKGAKAVIFDITDSPNAENELNARKSILQHPVIVISGDAAHSLMSIVSRQKVLKAKISVKPDVRQTQASSGEYVDMVIFMTCFVLITVTCFILLLKIKWKQTKKESSLAKMAFDAVSGMESKKYEERDGVEPVKRMKEKQRERKLSICSCSVVGISCVICLEEFKEGQEIRVVSCGHEFHLKCVDPWLLTNYTCPLCMLNIVEREGKGIKTESRCTLSFRSLFRCCFASSPLSSSSMVYSITLEDTPNDSLSFVSNAAAESLHFSPLSPNFNHNLWTEHLPVLPVLTNGDLQDSQTTGSHGSATSTLCVPSSIIMNKDISQLAVSKSPSVHGTEIPYLQESDGRLRQENTAKAIQIADLGIRKYAELGDAV